MGGCASGGRAGTHLLLAALRPVLDERLCRHFRAERSPLREPRKPRHANKQLKRGRGKRTSERQTRTKLTYSAHTSELKPLEASFPAPPGKRGDRQSIRVAYQGLFSTSTTPSAIANLSAKKRKRLSDREIGDFSREEGEESVRHQRVTY